MAIPLLSLSVLLQFAAAILAVRLIRISGRAAAWVLIAGAITLMGIRRSITFFRVVTEHAEINPDVSAELVDLVISLLMVVGVALIGRIFEALRRSEQELKASQARYSTLVYESPDGIIALDAEGIVETYNRSAEQITGVARSDAIGSSLSELALLDEQHSRVVDAALAVARTGQPVAPLEVRIQRADGGTSLIEFTPRLLRWEDGEIGTQIVLRDVEARKEIEQQLHQSQKLEALGLLAGGVAHDFNNLLTVIMGGVGLITARNDTEPRSLEVLEDIQAAAERAAEMTQQLLAFGRRQLLLPQQVSLDRVVYGLKSLLKPLLGEKIEIVTEVDGSDHTVLADPNQLEQVIINLAANAKAAMPDGGTLTIGIRRASEELSRGLSGEAPHGWIELRIADDGMGMDPEVMSRIFEPFFTTKPQGEGTGLGLATVLGIVGQSGGHVRVESTPGEGTSFRIYLPVQTETEIEAVLEKAERSATPAAGSGCVLLVEDEELVRISTQRTLEAAGYRVIAAANGERGLQLFRENSDEIAIVLTDMVMLNMSGTELSEAIHREHPDLPVIIMSGYTADQDAIRGSKAHFVSKPFSPQLLTEEIEALLRS